MRDKSRELMDSNSMNTEQIIFLITVVALIFLIVKKKQTGRIKYIESYVFPTSHKQGAHQKYPYLLVMVSNTALIILINLSLSTAIAVVEEIDL